MGRDEGALYTEARGEETDRGSSGRLLVRDKAYCKVTEATSPGIHALQASASVPRRTELPAKVQLTDSLPFNNKLGTLFLLLTLETWWLSSNGSYPLSHCSLWPAF